MTRYGKCVQKKYINGIQDGQTGFTVPSINLNIIHLTVILKTIMMNNMSKRPDLNNE